MIFVQNKVPQLLFLIFFSYNLFTQKNKAEVQDLPSIEISVKEETEGFISFKITNTGKQVFLTGPVCSSNNKIILIPEKGKKVERKCLKKINPIEILAGESLNRQIYIIPILDHYNLKDEKDLQLIWSVYGIKSVPLFLNRS